MTQAYIMNLGIRAVETAMLVAAPVLLVSLAVGLLVSVFQAITQINEMTLSFIPKVVAVVAVLVIFFPWMLQVMLDFTRELILSIPSAVKG